MRRDPIGALFDWRPLRFVREGRTRGPTDGLVEILVGGDGENQDTFVEQVVEFLAVGPSLDASGFGIPVVNSAGFLGEALAHILQASGSVAQMGEKLGGRGLESIAPRMRRWRQTNPRRCGRPHTEDQ